jgi:ferrous iron transport protein A
MGWFRSNVTDEKVPTGTPLAPSRPRLSFSDLRTGQMGRIVAVSSSTASAVRLQEMGLSVGAEFKIIEVAPFGDPVQVSLRGYRLCLRKREAKDVEVELIEQECPCDRRR